jgi:Secretion system C-terminal sorting domain
MYYTPTGDLTDVKTNATQAFALSETLKLQLEIYDTQLNTLVGNIELLQAEQAIAIDPAAYDSQIHNLKVLYETTEQAKTQLLSVWKMQTDNEADNLKAVNAAIQPILLQEVNQKLVNDIYFSTIAKGEKISDGTGRGGNQKILLQQIAAQCPYTGGAAVYEARSLLATEDQGYDDQVICAEVGVNYRKASPTASGAGEKPGASIYPNPAHNSALISADFTQKGRIECVDMLGRTIETLQWNGGSAQRINLNSVESGMYWLRIVGDNGEIVQIGKLTVSK